MKRTIALLLILALSLSAVGCGNESYFAKEAPREENVRIGITTEPMTLDPGRYTTTEEATLINHLFEGLTAEDENGTIVGAAAESWQVSTTKDAAKRPVYTFTLREDAQWSDGTPVKAEDFVYAWTRIISGEAASPYAYLFGVIRNATAYAEDDTAMLGLEAKDDTTLVVTLEGDCAYFPALTALPAFFPVREDVVSGNAEGWFNDPATLIGNGAYTMTEWTHDDHLTFAKNAGYRAADAVTCQSLDFVIRSGEALQKAAKDGTLQAAFADLTPGTRTKARDGSIYYFAVNTDKVTDAKVRLALSLALDRDAILNGAGFAGEVMGDETVQYRADTAYRLTGGEPLLQNTAAAVLAEAKTVPESLTLLTNYVTSEENDVNVLIAKAAAAQWEALLDIPVTVKAMPYDDFVKTRDAGDYDIVRCGMVADFDDPAAYLELFESGAAGNFANYSSKDYDTLLKDSRSELDAEERAKLLEQAEALLVAEDAAVIPLRAGTVTLSHVAALNGFTMNGLGIWNFACATYQAPTEEPAAEPDVDLEADPASATEPSSDTDSQGTSETDAA